MRSSKSRSRSKSNRNNRSPANNLNRVFDSSGPEGKVRGTPQQIIDKYVQLARDAFLANDRVAAENFQQHAEHYTRLLAEAQRDADEQRAKADQANRERQQQSQKAREGQRSEGPGEELPGFITAPQNDSVDMSATEVVDMSDGAEGDSGLVETPEEKPKRTTSTRSRKPRTSTKKAVEEPAAEAEAATGGETPEAAE